jgi:hypothetical protein
VLAQSRSRPLLTRRPCSAVSNNATASVKGSLHARTAMVRTADVARRPGRIDVSAAGVLQQRTTTQRASRCCLSCAPRPRSGRMARCRDSEARQPWLQSRPPRQAGEAWQRSTASWRLGNLMPGIAATTKSPPARAEQLRSRHAMPTRLFDSERTFGQFRRMRGVGAMPTMLAGGRRRNNAAC